MVLAAWTSSQAASSSVMEPMVASRPRYLPAVDRKLLLHAVKGMALLHLSDTGWEFLAVRHDSRTWGAFQGLLAFATWLPEHTDMTTVTAAVRAGREEAA